MTQQMLLWNFLWKEGFQTAQSWETNSLTLKDCQIYLKKKHIDNAQGTCNQINERELEAASMKANLKLGPASEKTTDVSKYGDVEGN